MVLYTCEKCEKPFTKKDSYVKHQNRTRPCTDVEPLDLIEEKLGKVRKLEEELVELKKRFPQPKKFDFTIDVNNSYAMKIAAIDELDDMLKSCCYTSTLKTITLGQGKNINVEFNSSDGTRPRRLHILGTPNRINITIKFESFSICLDENLIREYVVKTNKFYSTTIEGFYIDIPWKTLVPDNEFLFKLPIQSINIVADKIIDAICTFDVITLPRELRDRIMKIVYQNTIIDYVKVGEFNTLSYTVELDESSLFSDFIILFNVGDNEVHDFILLGGESKAVFYDKLSLDIISSPLQNTIKIPLNVCKIPLDDVHLPRHNRKDDFDLYFSVHRLYNPKIKILMTSKPSKDIQVYIHRARVL